MLVTQQKRTNVLLEQFTKIKQLDDLQLINSHFWLGYIAAYSRSPQKPEQWKKLMNLINAASDACADGLFTEKNFIELMLVSNDCEVCTNSRESWLKDPGIKIEKISKQITKNMNELSSDRNYCQNLYFKEEQVLPQIMSKNSDLGLICPICCESITHSTVCPISCGHLLHKKCFQEYIKTRVESKLFPMICPEEGCAKDIPSYDIEEYIQEQIVKKYLEFSLHEFVDKSKETSWCPTAGCSAIFQFDEELTEYRCPSCKKSYCLKCRTESHKNLTCEQKREIEGLAPSQKQFVQFVKGAKYKQCPNCKFWVSKNRGCDHMTCRCQYQFCYRCGAEYGSCDCQENESFYDSRGSDDDGDGSEEMIQ